MSETETGANNQHIAITPEVFSQFHPMLQRMREIETPEKATFLQQTIRAVTIVENVLGEKFTPEQQKYLNTFAIDAFTICETIGQNGMSNHMSARRAFAYGLAEVAYARKTGQSIVSKEFFDDFTTHIPDALQILKEVPFLFGQSLTPEDTPENFIAALGDFHNARSAALTATKGARSALEAFQAITQQYPYAVLALPVYEIAKNHNIEKEHRQAGSFASTELETTTFCFIQSELPPHSPKLSDLAYKQYWSSMVVLVKDYLLRSTSYPAFAFADYIFGVLTNLEDYSKRFVNGRHVGLQNFLPHETLDDYNYIQESIPKSLWGGIDKILRDSSITQKLKTVYFATMGKPYEDEKNLSSPYYFTATRTRIEMLELLIDRYMKDPKSNKNVEEFLNELAERMRSKVYDMERTRVLVSEENIWNDRDFSLETQGPAFDTICATLSAKYPDGFIILDARVKGKGKIKKIFLKDISQGSSAYAVLRDWYEQHLTQGALQPGSVERVYGSVIFTDTKLNGAHEIQLIPLKYARAAWQSRWNFHLLEEGEEGYRNYQNEVV